MLRPRMVFAIMCICAMASAKEPSAPAPSLAESEPFKDVKVLNNLCWELLNVAVPQGADKVAFSLPMARWVYIRSDAVGPGGGNREARVVVDSDLLPAMVHRKTGSLEAMRHLAAG